MFSYNAYALCVCRSAHRIFTLCNNKKKKKHTHWMRSLCIQFRTIKWKLVRVCVWNGWPPNNCMLRTQGKMILRLNIFRLLILFNNIDEFLALMKIHTHIRSRIRIHTDCCCETLIFLPRRHTERLPAVCLVITFYCQLNVMYSRVQKFWWNIQSLHLG